MQIDVETWQRLQKVRRHGETISDCIVRVIILTQRRRGLRQMQPLMLVVSQAGSESEVADVYAGPNYIFAVWRISHSATGIGT